MNDQQALARYRYMLTTAPPAQIERAHTEAFAKLTPAQRQAAMQKLALVVPPSEITGSDPISLARTATRAEMRRRGTLEGLWSADGAVFLMLVAGSVIATEIGLAFFASDLGLDFIGGEGLGGDLGGGDFGGGDLGGGFGGFGGF